jgi:outer membrane protein assembly factor BamD
MHRIPLAVLLAVSVLACSHTSGELVGKTAEQDYQIAMSSFKDEDWAEAQIGFDRLRLKYPYSKYAALAELRVADVKYTQGKYTEAAEAYRHFVRMHPSHEEVDYASFRIGVTRWVNAPSRFFLLPPDYEKDLTDVRAAASALEDFLKSFPKSTHVPEAKKVLAEVRDKLAEHEWYVAEFYRKRDRWPAVAVRLEGLVHDYPGSKFEPQALLNLTGAYLQLQDRNRAQQTLQQLVARYPQDPSRTEAEKLLARQ